VEGEASCSPTTNTLIPPSPDARFTFRQSSLSLALPRFRDRKFVAADAADIAARSSSAFLHDGRPQRGLVARNVVEPDHVRKWAPCQMCRASASPVVRVFLRPGGFNPAPH